MIFKEDFGTYQGKNATLYVLKNEFLEVGVTDFGAVLNKLVVNTKNGKVDIICSNTSCEEYINADAHMGGCVGRVANRIANASFVLNGEKYTLDENIPNATLHSGFNPYDYRFFNAEIVDDTLRLSLDSPDLDQGFPGNLQFVVEFKLDKNALIINFFGTSDKDTIFNPTNHAYFNLNGEGSGKVYDTLIQINADKITLADENLVVTGETLDVENTPFDFKTPKTIAPSIFEKDRSLTDALGFDQNFILNGEHVATCVGGKTGIQLDMYTDYPGVQFYCGNMLKNTKGKSVYNQHEAFCLEPQYFPNAINVETFEKPILKANQQVKHYIKYVITENHWFFYKNISFKFYIGEICFMIYIVILAELAVAVKPRMTKL